MCDIKTPNFSLVSVPIGSTTATKFTLPVDQVLEKAKKIVAIQAYKVGDVSNSPVDQSAVVNDTVFKKSFLVIRSKMDNQDVINKIPLSDLCRSANGGVIKEFSIPQINVTMCTIEVATIAALSTAEVYLLGFHFEK